MAYDPIADLKRQGVPCDRFDQPMLDVLGQLSQSEAASFASIWHKANSRGLNNPVNSSGQQVVSWIWGKSGY